MTHGLRCPRLDGIQQVFLYPNLTDISMESWLQDTWNVCTAVPASLHVSARHAGVDQVGLLRMLNRERTWLLHECFGFVESHSPTMRLYVDAVPHCHGSHFNFTLPGRFGGNWVSVYIIQLQVESLKVFILCYEVDAAWVPTTPDSDAESILSDNSVPSPQASESSVWTVPDSDVYSDEENEHEAS